ncbi:hypothetical protein NW768_007721 [Fusarium equiseti]|uniref:Uncharacterized protein n=1 Tax=Fusarium equiseti TaxID=61235 RepID=A0ABQ8R8H2_FUSEQ|nr:hypothetical protein NW768_007721 [Fusarium equiseti]
MENEVLCLKGPEPATLLIDQHKDIVCFRISDWYEEPHWGSGFHFYLSYADLTDEGFPHKVAFEIDGIWDYQHPLWRKMQRDTTSGYNPEDDDYYPFLHISIMDKNIHWFRDHNTVDDTYADSDNEFTVVKWGNLCPCNQRGMWSGALAFLMYIDWGFRHPIDEVRLYAAKVGILVRRDNEVMPCQSCQAGAKSDRPLDHLLDSMNLPTTEGDENVEESSEEEQEHARQ